MYNGIGPDKTHIKKAFKLIYPLFKSPCSAAWAFFFPLNRHFDGRAIIFCCKNSIFRKITPKYYELCRKYIVLIDNQTK